MPPVWNAEPCQICKTHPLPPSLPSRHEAVAVATSASLCVCASGPIQVCTRRLGVLALPTPAPPPAPRPARRMGTGCSCGLGRPWASPRPDPDAHRFLAVHLNLPLPCMKCGDLIQGVGKQVFSQRVLRLGAVGIRLACSAVGGGGEGEPSQSPERAPNQGFWYARQVPRLLHLSMCLDRIHLPFPLCHSLLTIFRHGLIHSTPPLPPPPKA